jgi:hypothetical protein
MYVHVQVALLKAVLREAPKMDEQELGSTVFALGRLGLHWAPPPTSHTPTPTSTSTSTSTRGTSSAAAAAEAPVAARGCLPQELRRQLEAAITVQVAFMGAAAVAQTLLGLGRMRLTWGTMPPALRAALADAVASALAPAPGHAAPSPRAVSGSAARRCAGISPV